MASLTPANDDDVVSKKSFQYLSGKISTEWKDIGRHLNVPDSKIGQIQIDYPGDTKEHIYQMFLYWKQESGSEATYNTLYKALRESNRNDLVEEMKQRHVPNCNTLEVAQTQEGKRDSPEMRNRKEGGIKQNEENVTDSSSLMILGPSRAGKSTIGNILLGIKADDPAAFHNPVYIQNYIGASVSPITYFRQVQGVNLTVIDMSKSLLCEKKWYKWSQILSASKSLEGKLDAIVLVGDAGDISSLAEFLEFTLKHMGKSMTDRLIVVFNKYKGPREEEWKSIRDLNDQVNINTGNIPYVFMGDVQDESAKTRAVDEISDKLKKIARNAPTPITKANFYPYTRQLFVEMIENMRGPTISYQQLSTDPDVKLELFEAFLGRGEIETLLKEKREKENTLGNLVWQMFSSVFARR